MNKVNLSHQFPGYHMVTMITNNLIHLSWKDHEQTFTGHSLQLLRGDKLAEQYKQLAFPCQHHKVHPLSKWGHSTESHQSKVLSWGCLSDGVCVCVCMSECVFVVCVRVCVCVCMNVLCVLCVCVCVCVQWGLWGGDIYVMWLKLGTDVKWFICRNRYQQVIVFKKTWYVSARLGISSRIMQRTWYL